MASENLARVDVLDLRERHSVTNSVVGFEERRNRLAIRLQLVVQLPETEILAEDFLGLKAREMNQLNRKNS